MRGGRNHGAAGRPAACKSAPALSTSRREQLLENDRVTVWDVVWPKGQPTALHRHPYALAGVYLKPGTRVITDADGSKRNVTNEAGGITFQLKGLTHVEEGTSDAPLHAIMIELKQDAPIGDDPSADLPPAFPREGAKPLLRTTGSACGITRLRLTASARSIVMCATPSPSGWKAAS